MILDINFRIGALLFNSQSTIPGLWQAMHATLDVDFGPDGPALWATLAYGAIYVNFAWPIFAARGGEAAVGHDRDAGFVHDEEEAH